MKKLACLTLAAALSLTALSGCSPKAPALPKLDPESPVSLEIWHYYNGPQKDAFDSLVTEFNETVGQETGIVVEAFSQGNVNELTSKVLDAAAHKVGASETPDIFAAYADTAYQVDKLGLLADLTPYLSEEELAAYRPEFIAEGHLTDDGTLKVFPIAKSVELLMLNATDWAAFSTATGASLSDLETIEGVTRTAQTYYEWTDSLTPEPDDGKAFFGRDAMANYFIIGSRQLGVELFARGKDGVTINADEAVFRKLWDNYYVPYINGWFSAQGNFRTDAAHTGAIIALVGSSSGSTYFPTEVTINDLESYPIDYAVYPAPIFDGGEPYAVQQGAGMCVIASDPAVEYASTVFLKWFTDPERNAAFSAGSGYLPVTNEALTLPVLESALSGKADDTAAGRMRDTLSAGLDQLNACTCYTTPAFDGGNTCRSVLEKSMSEKADIDRQAILALTAQGTSLADAVARYDTDTNFQGWFDQLKADLSAAQAAG